MAFGTDGRSPVWSGEKVYWCSRARGYVNLSVALGAKSSARASLSGRSAAWLARLVRDQEVDGSNPFAPTISFGTNNLQTHNSQVSAWCWTMWPIVQVLSLRQLQIPTFHWFTLHLLFRWQRRFVYQCRPT